MLSSEINLKSKVSIMIIITLYRYSLLILKTFQIQSHRLLHHSKQNTSIMPRLSLFLVRSIFSFHLSHLSFARQRLLRSEQDDSIDLDAPTVQASSHEPSVTEASSTLNIGIPIPSPSSGTAPTESERPTAFHIGSANPEDVPFSELKQALAVTTEGGVDGRDPTAGTDSEKIKNKKSTNRRNDKNSPDFSSTLQTKTKKTKIKTKTKRTSKRKLKRGEDDDDGDEGDDDEGGGGAAPAAKGGEAAHHEGGGEAAHHEEGGGDDAHHEEGGEEGAEGGEGGEHHGEHGENGASGMMEMDQLADIKGEHENKSTALDKFAVAVEEVDQNLEKSEAVGFFHN